MQLSKSLTRFLMCLVLSASSAASGAAASKNASGEDPEILGYDSIVNQLNREAERPVNRARLAPQAPDTFDMIWFHGGVGVSMLMQSITFEDGKDVFLGQKGMQISGGIDLFSRNMLAEVTMRNFGESDESPIRVSVKEFELKLIYHDHLVRKLHFHAGGGLSARYMTVRRPRAATSEYVTPTTVALFGIDYFIADRFSIGFEGAGRTAMISETIDRSSFDATIRLDLQL